MMTKYKNVGQPSWRRPNGELVASGSTFEATAREHARILRRPAYRQRLELVDPPEREGDVAQTAAGERWPLHMTPAVYLKLHPQGKHAGLARELEDQSADKEEKEEAAPAEGEEDSEREEGA